MSLIWSRIDSSNACDFFSLLSEVLYPENTRSPHTDVAAEHLIHGRDFLVSPQLFIVSRSQSLLYPVIVKNM